MSQTLLQWVKVCEGIENAAVVAAALDSLGLSPKVTAASHSSYDVWVSSEQAAEAVRFLGRSPSAGWSSTEPRVMGSLMAKYCTATGFDGKPG